MIDIRKGLRKRIKYTISIVVISLIIFEWLCYILTPWIQWPELPHPSKAALKVLIVGDPQLLGDHFTGDNIVGFISRWDSDRFVAKTFNLAYNYLQPDIIIFLGDNLDEGVIADDEEYKLYLQRFLNVFAVVDFNKAIILPGDNDIGGEYEAPSIEKAKRFDKYFKNDVVTHYKFLEFIKVNYLTRSNSYLSVPPVTHGMIRIVLSHIPLTPTYSSFVSKVLPHLQPDLIFSAHEHTSVHLVAEKKSGIRTLTYAPFSERDMQKLNLTKTETHEIMVPTCSYRMGTVNIGYGAVILEPQGELTYLVLWLPSRLQHLFVYIGIGVLALLLLIPFPFWGILDHTLCQKDMFSSYGKRI